MKVKEIYTPDPSSSYPRPLFTATVSAGFPSPADDYIEAKLDLNKHLIRNPAATYFVRVSGESMIGAGIHDGDILIVDRSLEAKNRSIVIAGINGELTVKRIMFVGKKIFLEPENDKYPSQEIGGDMQFDIWGVVTTVIHSVL